MPPEIIGVGELLWDMLPSGPQMGGAPANFACHAHALGADATVISRVGVGTAGAELVSRLKGAGVSTAGISFDLEHPTGRVDVNLGNDGQPAYIIQPNAAWDHLETSPEVFAMAERAAAICFGTLGQRSPAARSTIRCIVEATWHDTLRVFDANLRQEYFSEELIHQSLQLADVVKLNDEELQLISPMLGVTASSATDQLQILLERYELRLIACTRGGKGSLLFDGSVMSEHPGLETQVVDTIGAGDSFTAALTMGLLKGWPLGQISDASNRIASFVCSRTGATPPMPAHLKNLFRQAAQSS